MGSADYARAPAVRLRATRGYVAGRSGTRRLGYRRQRTHAQTLAHAALLSLLLIVSAAWLTGAALDLRYAGRALPTVRFESLSLGGLSPEQAQGLLDTHVNSFRAAPYVFSFGDREWRPGAAEVGLSIDLPAMANDAVQEGRRLPWPFRPFQTAATLLTHPAIPLRASLDRPQLSAFLSAVALEVDRAPTNAALSVRNGQVVAGTSAPGRRVDISATLSQVPLPVALAQQRVPVSVGSAPPALAEGAIQEAQVTASRMLAAPLTLRLGDRTWSLSPAQLGPMIDFRRVSGDGGDRLVSALADARVASFVKTLAADVDKPAVDAQLRWSASGVAVTRDSEEGLKLDQPAAVRAITSQAASANREVTLSAAVVKPAVTSDPTTLSSIKQLVATGSSKFAGSSPERVNNIQVAAAKLDGQVIPAGATFSFLTALGPITKEAGYQEGLTIQGDATVPGIGGGVCQVSTTVFRAAFYGGLPIVERHQHTYRVGYYEQDGSPVGFDAAVYDPGVDLRFKNDTGYALLLQAQVDAKTSTLTFRFYSTPAGREVKLTPQKANEIKAGPRMPDAVDPTLPKGVRKQVEWSADGVDATIRRLVTVGGQSLISDSFFSRYVPWREKWVVGTGGA